MGLGVDLALGTIWLELHFKAQEPSGINQGSLRVIATIVL